MRPCTSTNIHEAYGPESYYYSALDSMEACCKAGFRVLDLNLNPPSRDGGPLSDDRNWKTWIEKIAEKREELSIEFSSAHSSFYVHKDYSPRREEMTKRSIEAAGMLQIPWIVVHPYSVNNSSWHSRKESIAFNRNHFAAYADIARKHNTGIAIENMVESTESRRYGSCAEDLLELLDILSDPVFGLCWDFGHGERSNCNTISSLREMGEKLKVVHVHDWKLNKEHYDHTLPFLGNTDWASIMPVMKEIGFSGDWNYEIHEFTKHLPPELRSDALRLAYNTNVKMIQMAQ